MPHDRMHCFVADRSVANRRLRAGVIVGCLAMLMLACGLGAGAIGLDDPALRRLFAIACGIALLVMFFVAIEGVLRYRATRAEICPNPKQVPASIQRARALLPIIQDLPEMEEQTRLFLLLALLKSEGHQNIVVVKISQFDLHATPRRLYLLEESGHFLDLYGCTHFARSLRLAGIFVWTEAYAECFEDCAPSVSKTPAFNDLRTRVHAEHIAQHTPPATALAPVLRRL